MYLSFKNVLILFQASAFLIDQKKRKRKMATFQTFKKLK